MPMTGYDDDTARIGARIFTQTWRFMLAMVGVLIVGIAMGAGVTWLFT